MTHYCEIHLEGKGNVADQQKTDIKQLEDNTGIHINKLKIAMEDRAGFFFFFLVGYVDAILSVGSKMHTLAISNRLESCKKFHFKTPRTIV